MSLHHMDPHVGASFGLSFLIVGIAAVALHPARGVAPSATATGSAGASQQRAASGPVAARPNNASAAGRSTERTTSAQTAAAGTHRANSVDETTEASPDVRAAADTRTTRSASASRYTGSTTFTASRTTSRSRPPGRRPMSAFADAQAGETLSDVAVRIYGTPEATRSLWQANRDQLADPQAPLPAGMVLRTP